MKIDHIREIWDIEMNDRSFLTPILLLVAIGAPIVYHQMEDRNGNDSQQPNSAHPFLHDGLGADPVQNFRAGDMTSPLAESTAKDELFENAGYRRSSRNLSMQTKTVPTENSFQTAGFSKPAQPSPTKTNLPFLDSSTNPGSGALNQPQNSNSGIVSLNDLPIEQPITNTNDLLSKIPDRTLEHPRQQNFAIPPTDKMVPTHHPLQPQPQPQAQSQFVSNASTIPVPAVAFHPGGQIPISGTIVENGLPMANMVPDYGAAETLVFPGNAFGPDLTAQPMETIPIADFNEIFHFDISREWVKQRWKRVSTNPTADGLSGLRVALVTGTNSWDLNGALTYYFDRNQKLQRICYRGWAGDPQKLLHLLTTKYKFESQPTNIAGFYLAKNWRKTKSGLLMKEPPVIDTRNVLQQLGIVMEINNPDSSIELSDEFHALIAGSNRQ